jgi:hypothetical protein
MPPSPISGLDSLRAEGLAFFHLLAAATAISGVDTYQASPAIGYLLLAASVPAWYVFFREAFQLSARASGVAILLYAMHGLPLWFALYGYGRQIMWMALIPLALAALARAVRSSDRRFALLAGLTMASVIAADSRVGLVTLTSSVGGVGIYWLLRDRGLAFLWRLFLASAVSAVAALPTLWVFMRDVVASNQGFEMLRSSNLMETWGPGLGEFASLGVALGLEPNELAKVPWQGEGLVSIMYELGQSGEVLVPYLSGTLLVVAILGAGALSRRNALAIMLIAGIFIWAIATRELLAFRYGYFKLFGLISPLLLGLVVAGVVWLRGLRHTSGWPRVAVRLPGFTATLLLLLLGAFLIKNSYESYQFGAHDWHLDIPPALVQDIVDLGNSTPPGSKVYVTAISRYTPPGDPTPDGAYHTLKFQKREQVAVGWADRIQGLLVGNLVGRHVSGVFRTQVLQWESTLPSDDYDFYVLHDEDPRVRGLDPSDLVATAGRLSLYRSPGEVRASAERILASRGTLLIDDQSSLALVAAAGGVELGHELPPASAGPTLGQVRLGLLATSETIVEIVAGDVRRELALDPGLSWYSTPEVSLPALVEVRTGEQQPVRITSARVLPPGDEALDRSDYPILSSEVVAGEEDLELRIWLANTLPDWGIAAARVRSEEAGWQLDFFEPRMSERWTLRFPLAGGAPVQFRDDDDLEPMGVGGHPSLEDSGLLTLRLIAQRNPVREYPLASVKLQDGRAEELRAHVDPVVLRLWRHDDRLLERQTPDLSALEGNLVTSPGGLTYLVQDGRRRWVQAEAGDLPGQPVALGADQLWAIPPGLPIDRTEYHSAADRLPEPTSPR